MCLKKGLSNPKTGLLSRQMSVANTINHGESGVRKKGRFEVRIQDVFQEPDTNLVKAVLLLSERCSINIH